MTEAMKQELNGDHTAPDSATEKKGGLFSRILPLAVIAGALALFFGLGLQRYFSLDVLRENREALSAWVDASPLLAVGVFVLIYAAAVAISFPGASILTIFGGYLFGLWPGVPAIVVAATLGASIVFLAAKTALGDFLAARAGGFAKKMEEGFREDELSYMFLLRLAPVFPFWAVNIGAGLIGVSLRNFVIGTFFGIIPGSFVYASIGNAAGAAFDAGEDVSLTGILTQPATLLPIVGLALLALAPIVIKRVNRSKSSASE
ncbi:MAG: TVP38/TMEM64 family protein [Pseudomonadota bacterium]